MSFLEEMRRKNGIPFSLIAFHPKAPISIVNEGRSPGSPPCRRPSHSDELGTVAGRISGKLLVDYSCGDSSGLSPEFPFNLPAAKERRPKEPTSAVNI
jgi:hypothetical protein